MKGKNSSKGVFWKEHEFFKKTDCTKIKALMDQAWYIAGYDTTTQSLILLCDPNQPVISDQEFLAGIRYTWNSSDNAYYNNMKYSSMDKIEYVDATNRTYANYYGTSDICNMLKKCETNVENFSRTQQSIMKDTTVWTYYKKKTKIMEQQGNYI